MVRVNIDVLAAVIEENGATRPVVILARKARANPPRLEISRFIPWKSPFRLRRHLRRRADPLGHFGEDPLLDVDRPDPLAQAGQEAGEPEGRGDAAGAAEEERV